MLNQNYTQRLIEIQNEAQAQRLAEVLSRWDWSEIDKEAFIDSENLEKGAQVAVSGVDRETNLRITAYWRERDTWYYVYVLPGKTLYSESPVNPEQAQYHAQQFGYI